MLFLIPFTVPINSVTKRIPEVISPNAFSTLLKKLLILDFISFLSFKSSWIISKAP